MSESSKAFNKTGPEKAYYQALASGIFQIQQCQACSKHIFYPRVICSYCGSPDLAWRPVSGDGTVYSTTTVRRKAEHGGDLNIALIDLEEGVRMMSRVEGIAPGQVKIGMAVKARIATENNQSLVVFDLKSP